MIKKQLAFIQDCIEHDDIHPHIITYLDPKAVAQFLRCNKRLYYKTVLPHIWTQFITTPNTYTPHHLDLWKTLAIDRFRRDTPCEEDEERLLSLLKEEKLALSLQNDYQILVTDYQKKCNTYQNFQTLLSARLDNKQTLDKNQETQLVTLYHLHKQYFSCSDQGHFPEKAVSLMQAYTINLDELHKNIQTYTNETLGTEKNFLFEKLEENPGDTEEEKATHTRAITHWIREHPLLVYAIDAYGATQLHVAAQEGHTEIAQSLITARAEVNTKEDEGEPPLLLAVKNGHTAAHILI